jgi:hypothetical protein
VENSSQVLFNNFHGRRRYKALFSFFF